MKIVGDRKARSKERRRQARNARKEIVRIELTFAISMHMNFEILCIRGQTYKMDAQLLKFVL